MFRRMISRPQFAPFLMRGGLAAVLAVLGIGLTTRSASAADLIYVSLANDTIVRYDVSLANSAAVAAFVKVFVAAGQGLSSNFDHAFDTGGILYAANAGNNTIPKYNAAGSFGSSGAHRRTLTFWLSRPSCPDLQRTFWVRSRQA
jgi:hypothetical protein